MILKGPFKNMCTLKAMNMCVQTLPNMSSFRLHNFRLARFLKSDAHKIFSYGKWKCSKIKVVE